MISVQEIVCDDFIVVVCRVCKGTSPVAVAKRPYAGNVRFEFVVNRDVPALIRCNAGFLETQIRRVWNAARRDKDMTAQGLLWPLLTVHAYNNALATLRKRNTFRVQPNVDAFRLQNLAYCFGNIFVFSRDESRAHLYNCYLAAAPAVHQPEIDADITAANDDEMFWNEIDVHHGRVCQKRNVIDAF